MDTSRPTYTQLVEIDPELYWVEEAFTRSGWTLVLLLVEENRVRIGFEADWSGCYMWLMIAEISRGRYQAHIEAGEEGWRRGSALQLGRPRTTLSEAADDAISESDLLHNIVAAVLLCQPDRGEARA